MAGNTFTTYLNAKRSGSVDAEFASIEQRANKTFTAIQQKADAASRAIGGLTSGRGAGGARSSPVSQAYLSGFDQAKVRTDRLREAQERLARENTGLVRSLRTTGQTLQIVQGPLGPIAGRVNAAADALSRLTGVTLGLAGAGAALFAYTTAANRFVELRSKLTPLYESQEQVNEALGKVAGIAQRARSGLEPVIDLYTKMKLAADQFGISQERGLRITELAAKAATLSGGSSQSREAGLYQFAQGFGSGGLNGDELKSVRENTLSLATALSEGLGKLPEFKGIDTSIGKLKELGAQGKLTTDVIARALEASAGSIEEKFGRLPVTLGSAFTNLQNKATLFVGSFEQATGIVGTLAQGVTILGNNLGVIASLLGGVAAAWATVAAAERARSAVDSVRNFGTRIAAERTASQQALQAAIGLKSQTVLQTQALGAKERAIRANVVALERELAIQRQLAAEGNLQAKANPAGPGRRIAAGATAQSVRLTKELADEVEKLSVVQTNGATAARKLEGATKAVDVAKQGAAKSSSLLRSGAMSLLGAINPLGIAVGIATAAFLAWATAESQAEKNARLVEDAQRRLATVIDATTGKILEQNAALLAGARLNTEAAVSAAQQNYSSTRSQIAGLASQFRDQQRVGGGVNAVYVNRQVSASQAQARGLLENYGRGGSTTAGLVSALNALAKADPSLRELANTVTQLGDKAVTTARDSSRLSANLRLINGQNDAETRRRAQGDFSGGRSADQSAAGLSEAQIAARVEGERTKLRNKRYAAEVQMNEQLARLEERRSKMGVEEYIRERAQIKASFDSAIAGLDRQDAAAARRAEAAEARRKAAHERELARIEAENKAREQRTEKRSDILQGYTEEPKAVVKARDQIEDLQRMVGDTMNGLYEVTRDNPLGQGLYTPEMAAGDAARIQEGLQRPYNEYMESRQRDLNISRLLASGHELEAAALRQAYELYDSIGTVTREQYDSILANLHTEQRINDALAQRERLLAPLRASVDALRGNLSSTIEEFLNGGDIFKAGKGLFKGLLSQFNKGTAEQLAAKITGGLDERVRDLINGSVKVDERIADYIDALGESGSASTSMAESLDNAASAADRAAAALEGVAASAGGGVGGGGGLAGAVSSIGSALSSGSANGRLPSSFYKAGTTIGSGVGDNIIYKALGGLGVITDNLRSQSRQDDYVRRGLTKARVSDHTRTNEAFDVRLPAGQSFASATDAIRKTAKEMGYELVKAFDETQRGGTGRHGHYVFGPGRGGASPATQIASTVASSIGGTPASIAVAAIKSVANIAEKIGGTSKTQVAGGDADVVVTAPSRGGGKGRAPSQEQVYNKIGADLGNKLDQVFGSKFFGKLGGQLGTALKGAQTGQAVSGIAKALGLKQSNTGAAIGGAAGGVIGTAIGGPLGGMIGSALGGLVGGTLGGLFKKTKKASASVSSSNGSIDVGGAKGNSSKAKQASSAAAIALGGAIQNISDSLNATIGDFKVSIGMRKDKFVVDPSGRGKTKGGGVKKFATEGEAIEAALRDAIRDGAISGISAASKAILLGGKSLEQQLRKAQVIESIPRRLLALKDPVRFAVQELNREFTLMIAYLKEGKATAAQFAEAQELYDLERAAAIKQATEQTTRAIQDMIDGMLNSSSSPLNKRTVFENASAALSKFSGDVQAGKPVDTDAFLKAAADYQNASRELNGSNESFFADFDYLLGLLRQAQTNVTAATPGTPLDLPASPFSDNAIQGIISGTNATTTAVREQTERLSELLLPFLYKAISPDFSGLNLLPSASTLAYTKNLVAY